jgi:hypothetical protein
LSFHVTVSAHSTLIPNSLMTGHHFSESAFTSAEFLRRLSFPRENLRAYFGKSCLHCWVA